MQATWRELVEPQPGADRGGTHALACSSTHSREETATAESRKQICATPTAGPPSPESSLAAGTQAGGQLRVGLCPQQSLLSLTQGPWTLTLRTILIDGVLGLSPHQRLDSKSEQGTKMLT